MKIGNCVCVCVCAEAGRRGTVVWCGPAPAAAAATDPGEGGRLTTERRQRPGAEGDQKVTVPVVLVTPPVFI